MKRTLTFLVILAGLTLAQGRLDLMATLTGPSGNFGKTVISGRDINGGGTPDVIVGSYTEDAVYVYYGESFDDIPDLVFMAENYGDYFGYALSFCDDINSDGYPELVIGAPYFPAGGQTGKVYVHYGGPSIDTVADFTLQSPTGTTEQFGFSIACGCLTRTSWAPDIAIGAPNYPGVSPYCGRVYVFVDPQVSPDTVSFSGQITWDFDYFGYALAIGRMDGDADIWEELLVGCPYSDIYAGRAYLFYGSSVQMDTIPDLIWYGTPGSTDFFGYSVASIYDLNHDGMNDFAIGIPYRNGAGSYRGEVYVVYGKNPQDTTPNITLHGDNQDYAYFGYCVNTVRDINLDNWWDLMVGATNYNNGAGRVYLYLTSVSPFDTIYDAYADAPDPYCYFGISIAGCRDLNGDTYGDIVVGSDGASKAYVYLGRGDFVQPVIDSVTQINDTAFTGPFVISARSHDPNGSILADSIYYNINGAGFIAAAHDSVTGDKYYFHIPQQAPPSYVPTLVQWYLMFYDGANYAYAPAPGPADPFSFNIQDLAGPAVTGTTLWPDTNFTGPYPITCNATDNSGVAWVKLHYSTTDGQNNWMPMFPTGLPDQYSASIQTQNLNKLISYYVEATDSFQIPNTGYSPADFPTRYAFCLGEVPPILLVDADAGDTNEYYYKKILDSLDFPYILWPDSWGRPCYAFEDRDNFKILIWFTSLVSSGILTAEDMDTLVSFFNRGGKLFISSQNLGEDIGNTPFYQDWLHAQFDQPAFSVTYARAVPGDSVSDIYKDTIATYGGTGAGNAVSKDRVFPDAFADSCYVCRDSGGCYAIKYAADTAGGYRLVYFSVPFEAINHSPSLYAQRHPIMVSILKWFGMEYSVEEQKPVVAGLKFALGPIVPNPFMRTTKITYSLPASQDISLKIYDMSGRLVNTLAKGLFPAGIYHINWNGRDMNSRKTASGVYFLVLQNSEKRLDEKVILLR